MPFPRSDGPSRDGPNGHGELSAAISTAVVHVVSLYTGRNNTLWIGRFLTPLLTEALERYNTGDVSPETARLVAFGEAFDDCDEVVAHVVLEGAA